MDNYKINFTAYLVSAIKHERIKYINRNRVYSHNEILEEMICIKADCSFETQLLKYLEAYRKKNPENIIATIQNEDLLQRLMRLSERDQGIVFKRIFLDWEYEKIAKFYHMTEPQVQQAYHYAIRKMRDKR